MQSKRLLTLMNELCHYVRAGPRTSSQIIDQGKRLTRKYSVRFNPIGRGNSKTAVPSTYRPVRLTCPRGCPFLDGSCYALQGNVNLHQRRAAPELFASLASAAIAIIAATVDRGPARLHVSGDFYSPAGQLDRRYITGLILVARYVRRELQVSDRLAWSYTHAPPNIFEPFRQRLECVGITVLYSDRWEAGGAVAWPFDQLTKQRAARPELRLAACRAQLDEKTTCKTCGLCWQARDSGLTIVFDPHGTRRNTVRERLGA